MQLPAVAKGALPNRLVLSYIFDYLIIVVFILAFSALDKAEPYHQRFSLNNLSLQYPYADPERIPAWVAAVIVCGFPILVIIFWTLFIDGIFSHSKVASSRRQLYGKGRRAKYTMQERLWEMNCGILGLGLSVAAAVTITGALKNATGKPRPDIIDRCRPPQGSVDSPVFGLFTYEQCTGDSHILKDGFKSWPSGHSSTAFAGLGYLSIYLGGKLHVMDNRGEVWKTVLIVIPIIAASLIAVSRIMDARHHPFDVLSGAALGALVAWLSYRQYFPSLSETWKKGRAHPIRSWGTEMHSRNRSTPDGFIRAPEEEDGRAGYVPGMKVGATTGVGIDLGTGGSEGLSSQRRRQYLEEQESLQYRRKQAHKYGMLIGPGVSTVEPPGGSQYPQSAPPGTVSYPHHQESDSSAEEADGYEMTPVRGTGSKGDASTPAPSYPNVDTSYPGGYHTPTRQDTQSPTGMTISSQESEDRKWGIAQATSAISGGGAGNPAVRGIPTPVQGTDGLRRVELRD